MQTRRTQPPHRPDHISIPSCLEGALGVVLLVLLRLLLSLLFGGVGRVVGKRAGAKERIHRLEMTLARRRGQRRHPGLVLCIRVCAALQQRLHDRVVTWVKE